MHVEGAHASARNKFIGIEAPDGEGIRTTLEIAYPIARLHTTMIDDMGDTEILKETGKGYIARMQITVEAAGALALPSIKEWGHFRHHHLESRSGEDKPAGREREYYF